MVVKLRQIVGGVIEGSESIARSGTQLTKASMNLSDSASQQASSAEEVSSSIEEMSSMIANNMENSNQTEKMAREAVASIQSSNKAVLETVNSMQTITEKISVIGEIASQTNLLALNAAVEAARAGEHGKGFAVVAAEIRKLAERSQSASNEIDEVSRISISVAQKSGSMLEEVVPKIEKTSELIKEINTASIEQNSGTEQIDAAIQQLNSIIQDNAANAEEIAANSKELSGQADMLKDVVSFFKV